MKGLRVRKRRDDESGAAALEFALLFVPFLTLILGTIQFAFYFWTAETTNSAARETARRVVVGDCWTDYETFAVDHAPRITETTLSPAPAGLAVGDTITVTVTADADLGLLPWSFGLDTSVERSYEARMEVDEDSGDTCGG